MTDAEPSDKSPEQLRAELGEIRAELGDTVEELTHRVNIPAQVRAKKEDTIARLQATKDQAAHHVQESAEKARAVLATASDGSGCCSQRGSPCRWPLAHHRSSRG